MAESAINQVSNKEAWSLQQWLSYLNDIHPSNIELGLDRVAKVYQNLDISFTNKTVITVAGTNGKGTTCALVEQILLAQDKTVGVFSSPHLIDYRERVRVAGSMLTTEAHCQAFLKVDSARSDTSLTYFEFGTLAALVLLHEANADYVLLEVGLGGRLDAVNILDPNIAVITGIDLDHQDWLGDTKEQIAKEKAGIFRAGIPAIIGDPNPPLSLKKAAIDYKVKPKWQDVDFGYQVNEDGFSWHSQTCQYQGLPVPNIPAQNASTALQVIETLGLEVPELLLTQVFASVHLPGRRQVLQTQPTVMLDVAHNPQATGLLASDLKQLGSNKIFGVIAMLQDKDVAASLAPMLDIVDTWHCATLHMPRGGQAQKLVSVINSTNSAGLVKKVIEFEQVTQAYEAALEQAEENDCIIVFGSFFTIAEVLNLHNENSIAEDI
ncbi:bifunctional tetrahydrofolate synthase/dihydrofolate synthase [Paraglaciecola aquimarina]|uniref:Dihydrofolate synthase/folylpolyglutamate synthase n=1 Tax=Paraglaciecola algarum TaxID=3050085 RepID=A0ABS9D1U1_9ALTE|nr:bifunctional tetrahydrofolate synthase/dihydrofolate synthase [Paraglaciecola sp. G1-23]MCF2946720.1 bifunctional tetrahydrofolate synthase/dihydrofolate synthase [Paraglaciecola sp. G1-23]